MIYGFVVEGQEVIAILPYNRQYPSNGGTLHLRKGISPDFRETPLSHVAQVACGILLHLFVSKCVGVRTARMHSNVLKLTMGSKVAFMFCQK